jgi:hypothetical protein
MKRTAVNTIALLAASAVSACATISAPDYPEDHPANPNARAAAPVANSRTLAEYKRSAAQRQLPSPEGREDGDAQASGSAPITGDGPHDHH